MGEEEEEEAGEEGEERGGQYSGTTRSLLFHTGADDLRGQGDEHVMDDFMDSWQTALAEGRAWGGRGAGGRGLSRRHQLSAPPPILISQLFSSCRLTGKKGKSLVGTWGSQPLTSVCLSPRITAAQVHVHGSSDQGCPGGEHVASIRR